MIRVVGMRIWVRNRAYYVVKEDDSGRENVETRG